MFDDEYLKEWYNHGIKNVHKALLINGYIFLFE